MSRALRGIGERGRDSLIIQMMNGSLKETLSEPRDAPAPGARNPGQQATHVQAFESATNRGGVTPLRGRVPWGCIQPNADVRVAEATEAMIPVENRLEQVHVVGLQGREAGVAPARHHYGWMMV
jgi:hypothetical protein